MSSPFEIEIATLLTGSGGKSRPVIANLAKRWRHRLLNSDEQKDVAQFMVNTGQYRELFDLIAFSLGERSSLPWAHFVEILGRNAIKPTELEVRALVEGAESQEGGIEQFFRSPYLDLLDANLANRRSVLREKQRNEIEEKKNVLKDKLQFMRANRLFDQEAQVLEEIQAMFPEEPEFAAERESFRLRWAREIVANSASREEDPNLSSDLYWKLEHLSPDQRDAKALIVARANELAAIESPTQPQTTYDLAIALHLMDMNTEAVELLTAAPPSLPADWLRLELLILARRFVDALEFAATLEIRYAGEPDTAFATLYARARAFYGLHQTNTAIDLLRSLVRVRPGYKSAQSLLIDWSGGDV